MNKHCCRDCTFYSNPGVIIGDCHVNPPAIGEKGEGVWPEVSAGTVACGAFKLMELVGEAKDEQ